MPKNNKLIFRIVETRSAEVSPVSASRFPLLGDLRSGMCGVGRPVHSQGKVGLVWRATEPSAVAADELPKRARRRSPGQW